MDFTRRADLTELMDAPCDYETFRGCLVDLARVNRVTLAHRPVIDFLKRLPRQSQPLRIVDVGSGYGDTLRHVHRWASRRGIALSLTGVDLNPHAARSAREAGPGPIEWITANAFEYRPSGGIDVVISSLFTHHLTNTENVAFLRWMEETARVGWLVNDLRRNAFAYHGFTLLAKLMRWHPFVRHDGPVSILRSFSQADWQGLCVEAGLPADIRVGRCFPFRLTVEHIRQ